VAVLNKYSFDIYYQENSNTAGLQAKSLWGFEK